jgi:hypothetical protein
VRIGGVRAVAQRRLGQQELEGPVRIVQGFLAAQPGGHGRGMAAVVADAAKAMILRLYSAVCRAGCAGARGAPAGWPPCFGLQLSQVGAEGHRVLLSKGAGGDACHDHCWLGGHRGAEILARVVVVHQGREGPGGVGVEQPEVTGERGQGRAGRAVGDPDHLVGLGRLPVAEQPRALVLGQRTVHPDPVPGFAGRGGGGDAVQPPAGPYRPRGPGQPLPERP